MWIKFLLLLVVLQCAQAALKMHMTKREGKSMKLLREGKAEEFRAHRKLQQQNHLRVPKKHRASRFAAQPLADYEDVLYLVNATFGTPAQQATLLLDTFMGDTWVVGSNCDTSFCTCQAGYPCYPINPFDTSKSSTFKDTGKPFTDVNTAYTGNYVQDTIGLADGLSVPQVTFGLPTSGEYPVTVYPFSGVLGLTYQTTDGTKSVFQEAVDQGIVSEPIFTMFLEKDGEDAAGQYGGQITYGDLDRDHCQTNVAYVPVKSTEAWEFTTDGSEIAGLKSGGWLTTIDSFSQFNVVPKEVFNNLVTATGATYQSDFGVYSVPCDTKFQWNISIGGQTYSIDQSEGLMSLAGVDQCFLTFDNYADEDYNVLGVGFLRSICAVYDAQGQIGFSALKN